MVASEPDRPPTFDVLTEHALREGRSLKWSRYGSAIGAFVAEMDFGTAPAVTRSLLDGVERGQLGYATPEAAQEMARSCAGWLARRYGWELPPSWITPLADVVAGLQAAIERFTPPGTPVILPTPAYMPFLAVPGALGRELIEVPMVVRDGRMQYDLAGISAGLDRGARLVVHVNPHNPLGRVFDVDEQLALADVVTAAGARVFADEIHAPLVYPGAV
ncbi:MAG: aminotransferase class I/II-fold pyridoxal phosphate-dependent enzyme, partial [Blastococcus sp.]